MPGQKHDIENISEEIQRYLINHPDAADTLEGITKWWLSRQKRYEEGSKKVQKALYQLADRKLLIISETPYGKVIYKKE